MPMSKVIDKIVKKLCVGQILEQFFFLTYEMEIFFQ